MRCPHENAIHRAWLNAQRAKHAFRVINRETRDLESLPLFYSFFANVDAVDRARLRALIACDTSCQVVTVKTTISGRDRDGLFRVFKLVGKSLSSGIIGEKPISQRHQHPLGNCGNGKPDVVEPIQHFSPVRVVIGSGSCRREPVA